VRKIPRHILLKRLRVRRMEKTRKIELSPTDIRLHQEDEERERRIRDLARKTGVVYGD
jgi:hypothetical protein